MYWAKGETSMIKGYIVDSASEHSKTGQAGAILEEILVTSNGSGAASVSFDEAGETNAFDLIKRPLHMLKPLLATGITCPDPVINYSAKTITWAGCTNSTTFRLCFLGERFA